MTPEIEKLVLESALSRIWQHIQEPDRTFAVISAYREIFGETENFQRHKQLKSDIRSLGYGYIEQESGYSYRDNPDDVIEEKSFFIPNITKEEALKLSKKYQQDTILFKDSNGFYLLDGTTGKIEASFKKGDRPISLDPKIYKNAFSRLVKANKNQKISFAYFIEIRLPSWGQALAYSSEHKEPIQCKRISWNFKNIED